VNALKFHFRTALTNMLRNIGINLLTIFSICVGLFLIVISVLTVTSLNRAVTDWTRGFGIVVYLEDTVSSVSAQSLKARIEREPSVERVHFVTRDHAMDALKRVVGASLLEGLEENPLPNSLEIALRSDRLDPRAVQVLSGRLRDLPGVQEVQYGKKWLDAIAKAAQQFTLFGTVIGVALTVGILFILSNTIKIVFYRRATEIEILKLLGATRWFIRTPFLMEGTLVGLLAGILAALASYGAVGWLTAGRGLPLTLPASPEAGTLVIIAFGSLLGLAGSFVSLGRIRL